MTYYFLEIILLAGMVPGAGLSSESFDDYFAAVPRAQKECGPTAVYYCLRRFGRVTNLEEVKQRVTLNEKGASLANLIDVLHFYNVPARALRTDPPDVSRLPCPCILIIERSHCVVLERIESDGTEATIFDPAYRGFLTLPIAELTRQCSGEVIVFEEPGLSLPLFLSWTICSLMLFLALCLGMRLMRNRFQKPFSTTSKRL